MHPTSRLLADKETESTQEKKNSAGPFWFTPAVIQNNEPPLKVFSILAGETMRGG